MLLCFLCFKLTHTTEIYTYRTTLSLHAALPYWHRTWRSSRAQRGISFGSSPARSLAAPGMTASSNWHMSSPGARKGPAIPRSLFPLPCSRSCRPHPHHPLEQPLEDRCGVVTAPGMHRRDLEIGRAHV